MVMAVCKYEEIEKKLGRWKCGLTYSWTPKFCYATKTFFGFVDDSEEVDKAPHITGNEDGCGKLLWSEDVLMVLKGSASIVASGTDVFPNTCPLLKRGRQCSRAQTRYRPQTQKGPDHGRPKKVRTGLADVTCNGRLYLRMPFIVWAHL